MNIDYADVDKILLFMLDYDGDTLASYEWDLKQFLGFDNQAYVEKVYELLEQEKPLWVSIDRKPAYGWAAYIKKERKEEIRDFLNGGGFNRIHADEVERKATKARLEDEKLNVDLKLNKWLLKSKWLPHVLSAIAIIISLLALWKSFNDDKHSPQTIWKPQPVQTKIQSAGGAPVYEKDTLSIKQTLNKGRP